MTEDQLEQETLAWLADVGYTHRYGPDLAHDGPTPERSSYRDVLLVGRLREAIARLVAALSEAELWVPMVRKWRPAEPWPALSRFQFSAGGTLRTLTTMMSAPQAMVPSPGSESLRPFRTITLTFPQALALPALKKMLTIERRDLPGLNDSPRRRITDYSIARGLQRVLGRTDAHRDRIDVRGIIGLPAGIVAWRHGIFHLDAGYRQIRQRSFHRHRQLITAPN